MRVLVFTAHFDDELISCGGLIMHLLEHNDVSLVCTTDKGAVWRAKWKSVCSGLGLSKVRSMELPIWDEQGHLQPLSPDDLGHRLLNAGIRAENYDFVITHGKDGDIDGHPHHKQLYQFIQRWYIYGPKLHFVAFPRVGVKEAHPRYAEYRAREQWASKVQEGFIPIELLKQSSYMYHLTARQLEKKTDLIHRYFARRNTYWAAYYPVELYRHSRRATLCEEPLL